MGAQLQCTSQTGFYRLAMQSGLLTTVAAGTATAGHLFAFRWSHATIKAFIQRLKVRWQTVTAFTTAQEMQLRLLRATAYTASHSGGTAATLTSPNLKKATRFGASVLGDARIGTTGALTAGTHTFDAQEFGGLNLWSQSGAAPNVQSGERCFDGDPVTNAILTFAQDEGFIVRNEILMGAVGTGRLLVEVDWFEI